MVVAGERLCGETAARVDEEALSARVFLRRASEQGYQDVLTLAEHFVTFTWEPRP